MQRERILEIEKLRDRIGLFANRNEAGQVLSGLVRQLDLQHPLVLAIPAGGLLLMPEASNRCVCSYLIKATVALQPVPRSVLAGACYTGSGTIQGAR